MNTIFIGYCCTVWGVEPVMAHQTTWLERTGECDVQQSQLVRLLLKKEPNVQYSGPTHCALWAAATLLREKPGRARLTRLMPVIAFALTLCAPKPIAIPDTPPTASRGCTLIPITCSANVNSLFVIKYVLALPVQY